MDPAVSPRAQFRFSFHHLNHNSVLPDLNGAFLGQVSTHLQSREIGTNQRLEAYAGAKDWDFPALLFFQWLHGDPGAAPSRTVVKDLRAG